MAVKIRLQRVGTRNRPCYRVVITDIKSARDSKYIDIVGQYNPLLEKDKFTVDKDKVLEWIKKGAKPSFKVRKLLGDVGVLKPLDVKSLKQRAPKGQASEEAAAKPEEGAKKEEAPKQEVPKEEAPKEEAPKQEVPKEEAPKQEAPKEEPKKEEAAEPQK